ncbi:MAG: HD domain-containing protein [Pirellulales bacterium]|nr:HD domain-containing protein [Pirellulales bacterium]
MRNPASPGIFGTTHTRHASACDLARLYTSLAGFSADSAILMRDYTRDSLSHDPIHGYIPFSAKPASGDDEVTERQIIDHPWVQRLRQIHQLQTAWYVFPSAEHRRFQHVLGAMHLASRAIDRLYESLREVCPDVPSRACVESLTRLAALLHDVGHGPFGHFFDDQYLRDFGLTHETLGQKIIIDELGDLLRRVRRNPTGEMRSDEVIDPEQIAFLIARPKDKEKDGESPRWLVLLRALFCGIYTVDNMDFVLRDAYMSGYSAQSFDLDRLLHYSFFSSQGLTIHSRGLPALVRFISVRAELFRTIYFHRTVRGIDLSLQSLFADSKPYLFPGNPLEHLEAYQGFTDISLLVDVARWPQSEDPQQRELGEAWRKLLVKRKLKWRMACERTLFFDPHKKETSSIFSQEQFVEQSLRDLLPANLREMPLRVDLARHVHRPFTFGPTAGQNFLYEVASDRIRPLDDNELVQRIPLSYRICRVYAETDDANPQLASALDQLVGGQGEDSLTNM